jgi:hypothetical protein
MPRPPNDYEQRRPARTAKRTRRATAPRRTTSPKASGNAVSFLVTDTPQARGAAEDTLSLTPLQLLEVIIKAKLGDRIKDEEAHLICRVYCTALMSIWGDDEG